MKWLSCRLAEQEVRGSFPGLAATISEIGYLLHHSRDMAGIAKASYTLHTNYQNICLQRDLNRTRHGLRKRIQCLRPLGHLTEMLKCSENFYSLDGRMLINDYDFGYYKAALFSVTSFLFRWKRSNTFIIVPLVLLWIIVCAICVPELPMTYWFWSSTNQICTNYVSNTKQNLIEMNYLNIHYCNQISWETYQTLISYWEKKEEI